MNIFKTTYTIHKTKNCVTKVLPLSGIPVPSYKEGMRILKQLNNNSISNYRYVLKENLAITKKLLYFVKNLW